MLTTHGLSRPFDRVETFLAPGVLRIHLWMALAKFACGLDSEGRRKYLEASEPCKLGLDKETRSCAK